LAWSRAHRPNVHRAVRRCPLACKAAGGLGHARDTGPRHGRPGSRSGHGWLGRKGRYPGVTVRAAGWVKMGISQGKSPVIPCFRGGASPPPRIGFLSGIFLVGVHISDSGVHMLKQAWCHGQRTSSASMVPRQAGRRSACRSRRSRGNRRRSGGEARPRRWRDRAGLAVAQGVRVHSRAKVGPVSFACSAMVVSFDGISVGPWPRRRQNARRGQWPERPSSDGGCDDSLPCRARARASSISGNRAPVMGAPAAAGAPAKPSAFTGPSRSTRLAWGATRAASPTR
jgi:hypothetical protein